MKQTENFERQKLIDTIKVLQDEIQSRKNDWYYGDITGVGFTAIIWC